MSGGVDREREREGKGLHPIRQMKANANNCCDIQRAAEEMSKAL